MSLAIDGLVVAGKNQYNNAEIASTMGLVAFSLMLVVAAFESRDEKASILRVDTFDNRTLNITAVVEIALALLIARGAALTSAPRPSPARGVPTDPRRGRRSRGASAAAGPGLSVLPLTHPARRLTVKGWVPMMLCAKRLRRIIGCP